VDNPFDRYRSGTQGPFSLPYAGIHKEADLSANHAAASPVEPTAGDYLSDGLGGLGIPREQALKLGAALGLVPEWSRESGRALAAPFVDPTAGNIAGASGEAALMAAPFGLGKVAKHLRHALTPSRDEVMAEALVRADPFGYRAAYPELGVNWAQMVKPAAKAGKLDQDPFLAIANDRQLGVVE
jgi:hypothetical protein